VGKGIGNRLVTANVAFRDFTYGLRQEQTTLILSWIDREGPFWDEPRQHHPPSEYFACPLCPDEVVTDTALAEAACLHDEGENVALISVIPSTYCVHPLLVCWRERQGTQADIDFHIPNFWEYPPVEAYLNSLDPTPRSLASFLVLVERLAIEKPYTIEFQPQAHEDMHHWCGTDPGAVRREVNLISSMLVDPSRGIGKPEPLVGNFAGSWSRRIKGEDRIIYSFDASKIVVSHCREHYE